MEIVTSADGTPIATYTTGDGPTVVIVNGALSTARDAGEVARAFADAGMRAVTYDRRARGQSGDASPAEPLREVDDLAAVIAASGSDAAVIGHSSGAVLALYAAGEGVSTAHLFLSEPPFRFGEDDPASDLADRIQALVDDGRPGDAVVLFQREAVGLPDAFIEQFRASPAFGQVARLGRSAVYDTLVTQRTSTPTAAMLGVAMPVTILRGSDTMPILVAAASRLSDAMPQAESVEVPESVAHRMDPAATARTVAERLR
ncbi:alpha/beta fold hydrolase [Microbacterium sp. NPDC056234]|uniref:alpha/beta fold hydrolase n=1 Tax=Microbacterium sp. NPDC056234 TaxID=3345757 RepID=UPI0035DC79D2